MGPNGQVEASLGLLDMAIADLQPKVVFDNTGADGTLGNRLESQSRVLLPFAPLTEHSR